MLIIIYIVCMDFSSCSIYDNSVKQIYVYNIIYCIIICIVLYLFVYNKIYMFIFDIVDFSGFIVSQ